MSAVQSCGQDGSRAPPVRRESLCVRRRVRGGLAKAVRTIDAGCQDLILIPPRQSFMFEFWLSRTPGLSVS